MNENLDLVEILKDCPKGTKLYSTIHGEIKFDYISEASIDYPINIIYSNCYVSFARDGRYDINCKGECVLFPSKDQRDWGKFKVPVEKFDYNTLQPFDKVLVRDDGDEMFWKCNLLSHKTDHRAYCVGSCWDQMIPYNEETKHLVGTTDRPDEKYIWWEE